MYSRKGRWVARIKKKTTDSGVGIALALSDVLPLNQRLLSQESQMECLCVPWLFECKSRASVSFPVSLPFE